MPPYSDGTFIHLSVQFEMAQIYAQFSQPPKIIPFENQQVKQFNKIIVPKHLDIYICVHTFVETLKHTAKWKQNTQGNTLLNQQTSIPNT